MLSLIYITLFVYADVYYFKWKNYNNLLFSCVAAGRRAAGSSNRIISVENSMIQLNFGTLSAILCRMTE